jgi:hypothetical protein
MVASKSMRDEAQRQGMDYAARTGAPIVILTDGDRFELFDRTKGLDYEAMFVGAFQLTRFREADRPAFDRLRARI